MAQESFGVALLSPYAVVFVDSTRISMVHCLGPRRVPACSSPISPLPPFSIKISLIGLLIEHGANMTLNVLLIFVAFLTFSDNGKQHEQVYVDCAGCVGLRLVGSRTQLKIMEKATSEFIYHSPWKIRTPIKKFKLFFRVIWVSDPGTGPIVFVSKFCGFWWYLCVRNTDLDPDRTNIDFGTPLPTKTILKHARILLGSQTTFVAQVTSQMECVVARER